MSPRSSVLPIVALLALGACSPGGLEPLEPVETATASPAPSVTDEPSAVPEPTTADEDTGQEPSEAAPDRFEALGIDWPAVSPDDVKWSPVPAAPRGFTKADVEALATPLRTWAAKAALDAGVWNGSVEPAEVLAPIGRTSVYAVAAARRTVSPRLAVGNYFGDGVTVVGAPRMTSAWRTTVQDSAHGPVLRVWLQTRTAYAVEQDARTDVVGVVREHALGSTSRSGPSGLYSVAGWYEYGATGCPLTVDDALVPSEQGTKDALRRFVQLGGDDRYAELSLGGGQRVDAAYARRCGGVAQDQASSGVVQK